MVAVLTVAALSVFAISCTRGDETTTTSERRLDLNLQVVTINERSNGKIVTVSPGFVVVIELEGQRWLGRHWNVLPPDPKVVWMLPGPKVTEDGGRLQGLFTFTGLARSVGETGFSAEYVNHEGTVLQSFQVTFQVVSSEPTTTTSVGETTTTAAPTTTTTAATTTTSAAPSTTTSQATTTTEAPTTTTEAPSTTTTKPTLPPTTSTSFIERPPYPETPGTTYLDERNNGEVVNVAVGGKIVLTLGGNPSTGYQWEIAKIDEAVLRSAGEPEFFPESDLAGAPGYYVWTFDILKADASTSLALVYLDPSGKTNQYFYVGVVTGSAQITPY
jgi:predicted secreted protein